MKLNFIVSAVVCTVLFSLTFGLSTTASTAATYYVNNTRICSDSNAGTSAVAPLCTIETGATKSSAGDTVLVTPSTYNLAGTLNLLKARQTWQRANTRGYAVLDLNGAVHVGVWFHAAGCTLDGFKITNAAPIVDTGPRYYSIGTEPILGFTIRNCWIDVPSASQTNGDPGCVSCSGAIEVTGGGFLIENNIIHGGAAVGIWAQNTYQIYAGQAPGYDPANAGGTIRNNLIYMEGPDTGLDNQSQLGMLIETIGEWDKHSTWLIYNNQFISTTVHSSRSWGIYAREIAVTMRVWNNYFSKVGTCFYLQEAMSTCELQNHSCASEDVVYFNNTCDAGTSVNAAASGVFWGACIDSQVKSNLFTNYGRGIDFRGCSSGCTSSVIQQCSGGSNNGVSCTSNSQCPGGSCVEIGGGPYDSPGGGSVANNIFYRASNPNGSTDITYFTSGTGYVNVNLSSPQCSDTGPFSSNYLAAANPNLRSGGLLQSGSNAIDAGTNNPLGQGEGVCSVSDGSRTVNCAVDAKGKARGTLWDIGWDEFVAGGPAETPPGRPQ